MSRSTFNMSSPRDANHGSADGGRPFEFANSQCRWRQCLLQFVGSAEASVLPDRTTSLVGGPSSPCGQGVSSNGADAEGEEQPDGQGIEGLRFHVSVESFRTGRPCVFFMTVRRGDAVWQIKRRFRQVWAVHTSLVQGLGRAAVQLPPPPPRATLRSAAFGQTSRAFLHQRALQIERYLEALLTFIRCVDQCEALYKFLCYTNLRSWDYGSMIGGGAPPVAPKAVAGLPRKTWAKNESGKPTKGGVVADEFCVVCQECMKPETQDIRVLPCGHEFHFKCISQWLNQRNTCCVCNGSAVLTAPRFGPPE